jgi:hypothetical protein
VDPAGEVAQFGQGALELFERVADEPLRRRAARLGLGQP